MPVSFYKKAFTLVELAIVMTIIGLLIGGILKGQELLTNSRRTATIAQIKSYEAATSGFFDIYGAYPGDFQRALEAIPNCNAAICTNGNGDSRIGTPLAVWWTSMSNLPAEETAQYWKQLAMANLIVGIDVRATTPGFGTMVPESKLGGGFFASSVAHPNLAQGYTDARAMNGIALFIRNSTTATVINTENRSVTAQTASYLDSKMDDGRALSGSVQAVSSNTVMGCGSASNGPNGYNSANTLPSCEIAFKILN